MGSGALRGDAGASVRLEGSTMSGLRIAGGIAAAAAISTSVAVGLNKAVESIHAAHPSDRAGDDQSTWLTLGVTGAGIATLMAGLGAAAGVIGRVPPALGKVGALVGAATAVGGAAAFAIGSLGYGESVDTITNHQFEQYDNDKRDGSLNLHYTKDQPSEATSGKILLREDTQGKIYRTRAVSIEALGHAADSKGDDNGAASRAEVRAIVKGFDTNDDDRLVGDERRAFDTAYDQANSWSLPARSGS